MVCDPIREMDHFGVGLIHGNVALLDIMTFSISTANSITTHTTTHGRTPMGVGGRDGSCTEIESTEQELRSPISRVEGVTTLVSRSGN